MKKKTEPVIDIPVEIKVEPEVKTDVEITEPIKEILNHSVARGDTDAEGIKNQVPETHGSDGANSTVEMTAPPQY